MERRLLIGHAVRLRYNAPVVLRGLCVSVDAFRQQRGCSSILMVCLRNAKGNLRTGQITNKLTVTPASRLLLQRGVQANFTDHTGLETPGSTARGVALKEKLLNQVWYSHKHVVEDGFVTSRALQEVVYATLKSPVARVPPIGPVVERFSEQTHPGLLQPAAVL